MKFEFHYPSIPVKFLYLTIISAFTGTLYLSVPVGTTQMFPFRFLLILMWLLFLFGILINDFQLNLKHIRVKKYLKFFAFWVGYAFFSLIWAPDTTEAIRNIIFLVSGVSVIFFLVYYIRDIKGLKIVFWMWLLIFITLIPVGLWEITTGNHLHVSKYSDIPWKIYTPTTVFYNTNDFATYISLTLPLVFVWIRYSRTSYNRVFGIFILFLGLLLLVYTNSRQNYVAFLLGIGFWFLFLVKLQSKMKIFIISLIGGLLILFSMPDEIVIIDIKEIVSIIDRNISTLTGKGLQEDQSFGVRKNLIKNALYFTAKTIGFGVGAGNIEYYMANHSVYQVYGLTNAHNWWMEILVNYGILIFVGYLILYISLLLKLYRVYNKLSDFTERMICEALLVGWIGFFVGSGGPSSIMAFSPQWLFLGFILSFLNYIRLKDLSGHKIGMHAYNST